MSDSGWMDTDNFMQQFKKLYVPAVAPSNWSGGSFVDEHYPHISLEVIQYAKSQRIHLLCFPPHLTHILQPLDVEVYK